MSLLEVAANTHINLNFLVIMKKQVLLGIRI